LKNFTKVTKKSLYQSLYIGKDSNVTNTRSFLSLGFNSNIVRKEKGDS